MHITQLARSKALPRQRRWCLLPLLPPPPQTTRSPGRWARAEAEAGHLHPTQQHAWRRQCTWGLWLQQHWPAAAGSHPLRQRAHTWLPCMASLCAWGLWLQQHWPAAAGSHPLRQRAHTWLPCRGPAHRASAAPLDCLLRAMPRRGLARQLSARAGEAVKARAAQDRCAQQGAHAGPLPGGPVHHGAPLCMHLLAARPVRPCRWVPPPPAPCSPKLQLVVQVESALPDLAAWAPVGLSSCTAPYPSPAQTWPVQHAVPALLTTLRWSQGDHQPGQSDALCCTLAQCSAPSHA